MRSHMYAATGLMALFLLTGSLGLPLDLEPTLDDQLLTTTEGLLETSTEAAAPQTTLEETQLLPDTDVPAQAPAWASIDDATIRPGVQLVTQGSQCTANFVFYDASDIYVGQAAHCAGTGGSTATNGCTSGSLPLGTQVQVGGASQPGTLAYSSWIAMQSADESDQNACNYNDFALVRLHPDDRASVHPAVPFFGGPVGLTGGPGSGTGVLSYQNSGLRFGLQDLSPKEGISLGTAGSGWGTTVYTVTPGIPGDSGSGAMTSGGLAFGVLSTVAIAPLTGSNNYANLAPALQYAASHGGPGVELATWDDFSGGLLF